MTRQAKLQITGDARGFKKQVDEAKKSIESLGKTQPQGDPTKTLSQQIVDLEKKIKSLQETKALLGKGGIKHSELEAWKALNKEIKENKRLLQETRATRESISQKPDKRDKLPADDTGAAVGGGVFSKIKSAFSLMAGGMGIMSMWSRRQQMASERLPIRALTTDMGLPSEVSRLGFTPEERRQRALSLAQQASPMKGGQLTSLMNLGESVERAYGIGGEQSAQFVGAARRSGTSNQEKLLRNVVGTATGAGMQGPQVAEYLSSMTGFLSEMSKGVNIDAESLNGMAGAIGTLPFFKNDPSKIFDALKSMNQAFTSGDEYQKAQASRAISMSAPGASAPMVEFRRKMGMFGKLDESTMGNLKRAGVNTGALGVKGGELVNNIFKDIMGATQGMSPDQQLYEFASRSGMEPGAAASIFGQLKESQRTGKPIDMGSLSEQVRKGSQTPEERAAETMKNMDGTMREVNASLQRMIDGMAVNIAEPMARLATAIETLISKLGGDAEGIGSGIGTAGILGATAAGAIGTFGLGKILPKAGGLIRGAGGALARGASSAGGMLARGAGTLAGMGEGLMGLLPSLGGAAAGIGSMLYSPSVGEGSDIVPKDAKVFDFNQYKSDKERESTNNFTSPPTTQAASGGEDLIALNENTMSIKELTMAMRQQRMGGGSSRTPSYAQTVNRGTKTGK